MEDVEKGQLRRGRLSSAGISSMFGKCAFSREKEACLSCCEEVQQKMTIFFFFNFYILFNVYIQAFGYFLTSIYNLSVIHLVSSE